MKQKEGNDARVESAGGGTVVYAVHNTIAKSSDGVHMEIHGVAAGSKRSEKERR